MRAGACDDSSVLQSPTAPSSIGPKLCHELRDCTLLGKDFGLQSTDGLDARSLNTRSFAVILIQLGDLAGRSGAEALNQDCMQIQMMH